MAMAFAAAADTVMVVAPAAAPTAMALVAAAPWWRRKAETAGLASLEAMGVADVAAITAQHHVARLPWHRKNCNDVMAMASLLRSDRKRNYHSAARSGQRSAASDQRLARATLGSGGTIAPLTTADAAICIHHHYERSAFSSWPDDFLIV